MSKIKLTGSNSGYVEISSAADAGNLTLALPTSGTVLLSNADNVFTGITTFTGLNITDDVTLNGGSYDVVWDASDNQLEFGTNAKLSFGASSDLQIHRSGTHSYIKNSSNTLVFNSDAISLTNYAGNSNRIVTAASGEVKLYYSDSVKLETTNTGAIVTGICTATSFSGSGEGLTRTTPLSHRNILINGSCAVSQRGTSFSGTGFTLDRYYVGSGDYSVAQVTDAPSNSGLTYSLRISRTASTTGYLTAQMIELPATGQAGQFYNGAKFTLSGYVKGTSGATIVPTLRFSTGTGGSNGSTFTRTEGAFTCNGSWQPFTFHFTVDENVGGSDKCVQFYFTFVTTATGQNVFLTGLQLELGEQATPFEHRSYGEELSRCRRYFFALNNSNSVYYWFHPLSNNTNYRRCNITFPTTMRTGPTASELTGNNNGSSGTPSGTQHADPDHIDIHWDSTGLVELTHGHFSAEL